MASGRIEQEVAIKVTGQKDLVAAEKLIDEIDGKTATAKVDVDASGVAEGVQEVGEALDKIDGTTAEAKVSSNVREALDALDTMVVEAKKAEQAVEALGTALGPELTARMNVEQAVSDFQRMNLTLDDITGNADILAAKLREIDQMDVGGNLGRNMERARGSTDNLTRSVGGSRSVLANMVGNATQDLGALSGVAGSAGVAFGQMGEYMADAALEGEGLGSVIGNFAKVIGPVAALSVGIALVTKVIGDAQARSKQIAEDSEDIADGIAKTFTAIDTEALGDVNNLLDQIAANFIEDQELAGRTLLAMKQLGLGGAEALGEMLKTLDQGTEGRTAFFENFINTSDRVVGANATLAASVAELIVTYDSYDEITAQLISNQGVLTGELLDANNAELEFVETNEAAIRLLEEIDDAGEKISLDEVLKQNKDDLLKAKGGLEAYLLALQELGPDAKLIDILTLAYEKLNDVTLDLAGNTELWAKANKPIEDMPKTWESVARIANDVRNGIKMTAADLQIVSNAMEAYGLTEQQVLDKGIELWGQYGEAMESIDEVIADQNRRIAEGMEENQIAIGEFAQAMADLTGVFPSMERAMGAAEAAFDLHNAPLDAMEEVVELESAMRDLLDFVEDDLKGVIPNIFDPDDINREEFLNKFRGLREGVQREVQQAFAGAGGGAAGVEAGTATANAYVEQIFQTLEGALTREQIVTLLGLDDLQATLKIAIDQESLANAQAVLAAFVQLPFVDPLLAFQLQVGLAAGTITPEALMVIVNDQLKNVGAAELPAKMMPPDARSMNTARDQANAFYELPGNSADMVSKAGVPNNIQEVIDDTQDQLDRIWVTIPTKLGTPTNINDLPWWTRGNDAGGIIGPCGGLVAERRPEILNGRFLATQPMIVPPGTRVTSGSRTARILRTSRRNGLKPYDSGGTVGGGSTTVINFNGVGAIGNRFDLMRTIDRGIRDKQRLLGARG